MSPPTLLSLIRRRRSFKPHMLSADPVPREVLNDILDAAHWAPSHGQTEPWRFLVFTGESRGRLGEIWAQAYKTDAEAKGNFSQEAYDTQVKRPFSAPVWIALVLTPSGRFPEEEESQALACAVQNLHLAATAHNLGGQWTTGKNFTFPGTASALGINPPERLMGFFFLGKPNVPWPEGRRSDLATKVQWM